MAEPIEQKLSRVEAAVEVNSARIDWVEDETKRIRARLHEIENDRATVALLASATKDLGERMREFADGIDAIAERAVETVLRRQRENEWLERRRDWQFFAGWAGWAAVVLAALAWLIQHYH